MNEQRSVQPPTRAPIQELAQAPRKIILRVECPNGTVPKTIDGLAQEVGLNPLQVRAVIIFEEVLGRWINAAIFADSDRTKISEAVRKKNKLVNISTANKSFLTVVPTDYVLTKADAKDYGLTGAMKSYVLLVQSVKKDATEQRQQAMAAD
jgi:hypothetical protein